MEDQKTILVVDDDALIRATLKSFLKKEGYHVETASDGGEAMVKFLETAPALVLCDRLMPGVSGFEFLKRLRDLPSEVPFVFLTSLTDPRDKLTVSDLGVAEYLDKPVSTETLRACLQRILG
jgi:phosphoserine phosphatase RsbU/P